MRHGFIYLQFSVSITFYRFFWAQNAYGTWSILTEFILFLNCLSIQVTFCRFIFAFSFVGFQKREPFLGKCNDDHFDHSLLHYCTYISDQILYFQQNRAKKRRNIEKEERIDKFTWIKCTKRHHLQTIWSLSIYSKTEALSMMQTGYRSTSLRCIALAVIEQNIRLWISPLIE